MVRGDGMTDKRTKELLGKWATTRNPLLTESNDPGDIGKALKESYEDLAQFIRDETKKEMLGRNNLSDANAKLCGMCRTQTAKEIFDKLDEAILSEKNCRVYEIFGQDYKCIKKKYGVK